ncbi:FtsX-like permease family protein [Lacticaseibacillus jixiensis]|uniref:FtsX-like permease family protein n=1 Tax=Lacticaseibacillus jixiensis TaxID=3231926 RepID=UPI0036F24B66
MRFMERAIKALSYHRRPYVAGMIGVVLFSLLSVIIQTACQLNINTKLHFQNRLAQFDTSAVRSADHLIAVIKQAYLAVDHDYTTTWWLLVAGFALLSVAFTVISALMRRKETTAYLLVGKSPVDIVAQYLVENIMVFLVGFVIACGLAVCFGGMITNQLTSLNQHLFDHYLADNVSSRAYQDLIKQLFNHRLTDFSSQGLMFPHPVGLHPAANHVAGFAVSLVSGLLSIIVTQALVFGVAVWHQRRQLRHRA